MDIGYVWDEDKYREVQNKHGVDFGEVVDVFEGLRTLYEEDPQGHQERMMAVGQTRSGRILQVIFTDEDAPLIRLVTAFDVSKEWEYEFKR
ncbi:MAG: BrnT family toxin [Persicimonas sp.]